MNLITQRAIYYTFATQEIEEAETSRPWPAVAEFFGVAPEEEQRVEKLLTSPMLANLKTMEDIGLLQKCAEGFGSAFPLSADEKEVLEIKYQALFKLKQLAGECHMTLLKAIASAYRRDPVAAVLYAIQIFMHNDGKNNLGLKILSEALSADQNSDAGLLLLHLANDDKSGIYGRLSETPEMILHPEVLKELAATYGLKPDVTDKNTRIGF